MDYAKGRVLVGVMETGRIHAPEGGGIGNGLCFGGDGVVFIWSHRHWW